MCNVHSHCSFISHLIEGYLCLSNTANNLNKRLHWSKAASRARTKKTLLSINALHQLHNDGTVKIAQNHSLIANPKISPNTPFFISFRFNRFVQTLNEVLSYTSFNLSSVVRHTGHGLYEIDPFFLYLN